VDLDPPEFRRERLPALGRGEELWGEIFFGPLGGLPGYGVSVGNPHLVLWLRDVGDVREAPLAAIGAPLSVDPRFPEGVNVHVAAAAAPSHLVTRPWERGTGMTRACGSGAVAVFAVARRLGRAAAEAAVEMPGGTVTLAERPDGTLLLTGPAREVFRATWYPGGGG
jgi:diaminopimelate epimerase